MSTPAPLPNRPPPSSPEAADGDEDGSAQLVDEATREMRAAAMESIEEKLQQLGCGENKREIIEAVRQVVLSDVDARVHEKAQELWQKGKQMLSTIQQKHKDSTQKLADEVAACHEKQSALEKENEKLKQVLAVLSGRFQMLGAVLGAQKGVAPGIATPEAGSASGREATSPLQDGGTSDGTKLPDLPAFPFPSTTSAPPPASPAAPLLLAQALGAQTPTQRTPLSLANSLSPSPATESFGGIARNGGPTEFSFTLRKADGADLGLNVSHHEHDRVLRVEGIRPEGAVEAWNRQCCNTSPEKVVLAGDHITQVNTVTGDPEKMLEECRDKQLLRLTIVRGDHANPLARPSTLRAEAAAFVPSGSLPSGGSSPAEPQQAATTSATPETDEKAEAKAPADEKVPGRV